MKCTNCNTENLLKACYCKECGQRFTKEEKQAAYDKTVFGIIDRIENLWGYLNLDFITGSRWFQLATIGVLAVYMAFVLITNGSKMKIMDSPDYDVAYLTDTKVWCISTGLDYVNVELYIPGKAETVDVITVDSSNVLVSQDTYSVEDSIVLMQNENLRYIVQAADKQMEVFVVTDN